MTRRTVLIVIGLAAAIGLFGLGRVTAHPPATADTGYTDGFQAGRAVGVQEGRALQAGQPSNGPFAAGYVAGLNDAFGGYDGGWSLSVPYLITLTAGTGGTTYRIASRIELRPGVSCYVCAGGSALCQETR